MTEIKLIRVSSILVFLEAVGHMTGYPWTSSHISEQARLVRSMKAVDFLFFGEHSTYWNLYSGWGLFIAVLLLALAIILWLLSSLAQLASRQVGVITGIISAGLLACAYLSFRFFYLPSSLLLSATFVVLLLTTVRLMRGRPARRSGYSLLFAIFMLCAISLPAQSIAVSDEFALTGALIYPAPGEAPIAGGVVIVAHGKIMAVGKRGAIPIPPGIQTIDCTGQTLVAGFWNTHVHFMEPKWNDAAKLPAAQLTAQLQDMLTRYGFTSVVDIGSDLQNTLDLRRRVTTGEVQGPRILTAGMIIFPKDGLPYYVTDYLPPEVVAKVEKSEAATPAGAVRIVDDQLAQGADVVKLMAVSIQRPNGHLQFKPMPLPIVEAATAEAHRKGKLVFAHPTNMEGIELVLAGHVDVLAHTSEEPSKWDSVIARRLKAANVTLVPTLTLFDRDQDFDGILKEVKSYSDIGGRIMFGTDIGFLPDYASLTKEFGYLARAGLSFSQILASLTTVPAERLGFGGSTGVIKRGMDADLLVLDGDPAKDQSAFYHVALTMRQGRVIYRKRP